MTEIIYTITLWLALVMPTGEVVIVGKTADSPMACVREMKYRQINFDGFYKEGGA